MTTPTCPTCGQPGTPCLAIRYSSTTGGPHGAAEHAHRCDTCLTLLEQTNEQP